MLDSNTKHPENRIHLYDPVGLINDGYGGYRPSNYTVRPPRRQTVSCENFTETTNNNNGLDLQSYNSFEVDSFTLRSETINGGINRVSSNGDNTTTRNDGGLRFVIGDNNNVVEDDQSDASTPRLWRPSSVTSPKSSLRSVKPPVNSPSPLHPKSVNHSPLHPTSPKFVNYQTMAVNSRTQAIAKGRRELMDMVKDLPETFYELSLKDIVEQKAVEIETKKEIEIPEEKKANKKKSSKKVKKSESKKKMVRSKSVDNGKFLLKTSVFPILGSRKSKKKLNAASSFKVAPMPKTEQTSNGGVKVGDKEWWRRKSCISSESDNSNGLSSQSASSRSSSSSSRSNSSNGRRSNRFLPSCCLFNRRRIGGKK